MTWFHFSWFHSGIFRPIFKKYEVNTKYKICSKTLNFRVFFREILNNCINLPRRVVTHKHCVSEVYREIKTWTKIWRIWKCTTLCLHLPRRQSSINLRHRVFMYREAAIKVILVWRTEKWSTRFDESGDAQLCVYTSPVVIIPLIFVTASSCIGKPS